MCECLKTWLHQGMFHTSYSPYASQVVIVCRNLNSITIQDAFPLSHIDRSLQVLHSSNVLTPFDLVEEYLYLGDICIFPPDVSAMSE